MAMDSIKLKSDNGPAKSTELSTLPNIDKLLEFCENIAKSKMFPTMRDKFQVLAVVEYGRELGIKPIMALQTIHWIPKKDSPGAGTLAIQSKVLLALAQKNGIEVVVDEKNTKKCQLTFIKGKQTFTETFTWQDVMRARLDSRKNYLTYPEEMLFWRCVAKGLRVFDPGLALGIYTEEEIDAGVEQATIEVDPTRKKEEKKEEHIPYPVETAVNKGMEYLAREKRKDEKEAINAEVVEEEPEEKKPEKEKTPPKKKAAPKEEKKEEIAPEGLEEQEEDEEKKEDPTKGMTKEQKLKYNEEIRLRKETKDMTPEEKTEHITELFKKDFHVRFGPDKKKVEDKFREFKMFLMDWQRTRKPERKFVAFNEFHHISMTLGDAEELELLYINRGWVIGDQWTEWEKSQAGIVEEIAETGPDDISE